MGKALLLLFVLGGLVGSVVAGDEKYTAQKLVFNNPNGTFGDEISPDGWKDYYVVAEDDDSNIYFEVNVKSSRADALAVYIFEGKLKAYADRLNPGAFLDFNEISTITKGDVRTYSLALGQCYITKGTTYYLSIKGGAPKEGQDNPSIAYTISAKLVPARLKRNMTISGRICDQRFMHYFYEVEEGGEGQHIQATVKKTSGDLDAFYLRYEKCAGPAGSNLEKVSIEGHGVPKGVSYYPAPAKTLIPGRYYVSVKGKMSNCGKYDLTMVQFSGVSSLRVSLAFTIAAMSLVSLVMHWL